MDEDQGAFLSLGVALAIGLLIGVERGWAKRDAKEGERVAGVRTFGLIGLLGGGTALVGRELGELTVGIAFVGMALAFTWIYAANLRKGSEDVGITSLIASLLVFALGALAASGQLALAGAAGVVTTVLLSYKPELHSALRGLESREIKAGLQLLLISVVLLPILPNQGYGPWDSLNPYAIWWMVVLIASISFAGYFAIRLAGVSNGIAFTGLFGGLASSTATTLHLSRLARRDASLAPILASGVLLAGGTMLPRMLVLIAVVNRDLVLPALVPAAAMALVIYVPALFYWRRQERQEIEIGKALSNPLDLKAALGFGLLLVAILLLGNALRKWVGDAGVLALAAASGVTDVDAITLSLARMSTEELGAKVAVTGIVIAAVVNSVVKGGMAAVIGGRRLGLYACVPLVLASAAGLALVWTRLW